MTNTDNGYIKTYRRLLDWEWYKDANTMRVFMHCLLKANSKANKWQGIEIPAGSFITSRKKLAQELNLSERNIRTAINHLVETNEVTNETTKQYSIITLNNWNCYQSSDQQPTNKMTKQTTNEKAYYNKDLVKYPTKQTTNKLTTNKKDILLHKISKEENLNQEWINLISDWLEYKRGKNQSYKTEKSLKAFIRKLFCLSGKNIDLARAIIDESMANNWNGIFELKNKPQNNQRQGGEYVYNPYL